MKKIVSLILVLSLAAMLFVACNTQTTEQLFNGAIEKTAKLDSMDAVMEITMDMTANGQTITIPMTYTILSQGLTGDSPVSLLGATISMSSGDYSYDMEMQIYTEGDWAYVSADGLNYKMKMEDLQGETGVSDQSDAMMQKLSEDLFKDVTPVKNSDGSQTVTVSIPTEQFADLFDEMIDSMTSNAGVAVDDLTISNAQAVITVKDGYVTTYKISFTMGMTVEGVQIETNANASITYNDPGKQVTVTPPEGYQNFEELSLG